MAQDAYVLALIRCVPMTPLCNRTWRDMFWCKSPRHYDVHVLVLLRTVPVTPPWYNFSRSCFNVLGCTSLKIFWLAVQMLRGINMEAELSLHNFSSTKMTGPHDQVSTCFERKALKSLLLLFFFIISQIDQMVTIKGSGVLLLAQCPRLLHSKSLDWWIVVRYNNRHHPLLLQW